MGKKAVKEARRVKTGLFFQMKETEHVVICFQTVLLAKKV